jgi:hypothetical protein
LLDLVQHQVIKEIAVVFHVGALEHAFIFACVRVSHIVVKTLKLITDTFLLRVLQVLNLVEKLLTDVNLEQHLFKNTFELGCEWPSMCTQLHLFAMFVCKHHDLSSESTEVQLLINDAVIVHLQHELLDSCTLCLNHRFM